MHIPDGFLDAKTTLATAALSAAGLAVALRATRAALPPRKVPLLGLAAAFVFAAQMVNFPVIGGTSGHLIGGTLAAALLGPSAAILVLTTVLTVQCFAFADGGITALGANIFNMAIVGGVGGWMVYTALTRLAGSVRGRIVAAVVAAWASTVFAAAVCAGELAASGTAPWRVVFPAMAGVHALIGVGEGVITALVLSAVASARPELLLNRPATDAPAAEPSYRPLIAYGLLAALGVGVFIAPFACPWPDGLDAVARRIGFAAREADGRLLPAPAAEYHFPGLSSPGLAAGLAGGVGTLAVFGVGLLLARSLAPRTAGGKPPAPPS
jgi:cobalt/nickel transport system permease protein